MMANKFLKDFRCPQYVDFLDGMDSSGSPFFDCNEYQTPQKRNQEKSSPDCNEYQTPQKKNQEKSSPVPERGLTEGDENKLMNKMNAALNFIESTPKLKKSAIKEKCFTARAILNPIKLPEIRPLPKAVPAQTHPTRIRSKTVARLDKICPGKVNKVKDFKPKRSSSLSDLRTVKKHTLPKTPLCLKRTIDAKAKAKALKTTEELELEQITELQKQLSNMLRQNEIAYRKLNPKQFQRPIPPKNPETSKGNTNMNADKSSRRGFKSMSHITLKKVLKVDSIINGNSSKGASSKVLTTSSVNSTKELERSKLPSVSSSIMSEEGEKTLPLFPKKSANIGFHSGILFCDSNKKSTVPKPFNFEARMKQKKAHSTATDENSDIISSDSVLSYDMSSCKENFSVMKSKTESKMQNIMNMKYLTSKKAVGESNRNTVRGFPLSENRNRV